MPKHNLPRIEILCEREPDCYLCNGPCRSRVHREYHAELREKLFGKQRLMFAEEQRLSVEAAARKFTRKEIPSPIESL